MTDPSRYGPPGDRTADAPPVCYRHPGRETYIRCQRCGRPICPDCMHQAAVGFHCPDCVRANRQPAPRSRFGGLLHHKSDAATRVILGINVVVYLLSVALGARFDNWLVLIGDKVSINAAGTMGGLGAYQFWRLISYAFLHEQLWHIAINMFSLWIIGPPLEAWLGRARFVALYLTAGIAGGVVAAVVSPLVAVVGASGALFGVFGAFLPLLKKARLDTRWFFGVLALNVALNVFLRGALSWQAHLGGLVTGLLLGTAIAYAPRRHRAVVQVGSFVVVLAACAALVAWKMPVFTAV